MKKAFPFKVLIVEDDPDWADDIQSNLAERGIAADVAATINDAKLRLGKSRYHFISCDMKMPEKQGENSEVGIGAGFARELRADGQLALLEIYSGQSGANEDEMIPKQAQTIFQLSGAIDSSVYLKSMDGKDHGGFELTTESWAQKIADWLKADDLPLRLLTQAEILLPQPLANICNRLVSNWKQSHLHNDHWLAWIDLYQTTLHLCWAQMLAIGNQAGVSLSGYLILEQEADYLRLEDMETWLKELRSCQGSLAPWKPYFMDPRDTKEKATAGETLGSNLGSGLLHTLHQWRDLRNDQAHKNNASTAGFHQEYKYNLLKLIDLIAFWARYPLINRFEFIGGRGKAKVKLLRHQDNHKEMTLDTELEYQPGHVYLLWQKTERGSTLRDLWPWVHEEVNLTTGNHTLYTFSHAKTLRYKQTWYRRNLQTGVVTEWPVTAAVRKELETLNR